MDFAILVNSAKSPNLEVEAVDWALINTKWLDAVAYTISYKKPLYKGPLYIHNTGLKYFVK